MVLARKYLSAHKSNTFTEKDVHRTDRTIPLFAGEDIPHPDPDSPFAETGTNVHLEQMKDMLLTYNEHNPDLGYVQGMSDLLAPLYAVMQDDAVAFWAFVGYMDRMVRRFPQRGTLGNKLISHRSETTSEINQECVLSSLPSTSLFS
jgi:hypothetical protein